MEFIKDNWIAILSLHLGGRIRVSKAVVDQVLELVGTPESTFALNFNIEFQS
jgi:hypothetical protein